MHALRWSLVLSGAAGALAACNSVGTAPLPGEDASVDASAADGSVHEAGPAEAASEAAPVEAGERGGDGRRRRGGRVLRRHVRRAARRVRGVLHLGRRHDQPVQVHRRHLRRADAGLRGAPLQRHREGPRDVRPRRGAGLRRVLPADHRRRRLLGEHRHQPARAARVRLERVHRRRDGPAGSGQSRARSIWSAPPASRASAGRAPPTAPARRPAPPGKPCEQAPDAGSALYLDYGFGSHPPCAAGAYCVTPTCKAQGGAGASCTQDQACQTGMTCHLGHCAAAGPSSDGGVCATRVDCQQGLFCASRRRGGGGRRRLRRRACSRGGGRRAARRTATSARGFCVSPDGGVGGVCTAVCGSG